MKKILPGCILLLLCLWLTSGAVLADIPYMSLSFGADDRDIYMQTLYAPVEIVGQNLFSQGTNGRETVKGLANPSGLCIDKDQFLYVADRDNNRVVKIDAKGNLYQIFGADKDRAKGLKAPEGVYVTDNGDVYVADSGNARIAVFDKSGTLIRSLGTPDDVRLKNVLFVPVNVAVDVRGFIYTVLKGGNEGLLVLGPDGKFQGFFGRNLTELNLGEKIKRVFFTEEQVRTNSNKVAASVSGVSIGLDGYVYTCTKNVKKGQVKKFNARGVDLFLNKDLQVKIPWWYGTAIDSSFSSLFVNQDGIIFTTDRNNGIVAVYDNNGSIIAIFGSKLYGNDKRIGCFGEPCGIVTSNDGTLYVLDRNYNGIHVFRPTPLMQNILHAIQLYNDGRYTEAVPLWQEILKANSYLYKANLGLGKAAFVQKDWQESMHQMHVALNQKFYSDALWQYRAEWVQRNAGGILLALLILAAIHLVLSKVFHFHMFKRLFAGLRWANRRLILPWLSRIPFVMPLLSQLRYALRMLKHPVDTYYEVTRGDKGSIASAVCLYLLFFAAMMLDKAFTNFCFNKWGLLGVNPASVALSNLLPIVVWIVATYLVGAISKGSGTFRAVFISTMYALMPLVVFTVPLALFSNLLTKSEEAIYVVCQVLLYSWTGLLLFIQVKEVQGYELPETFVRILWVLFAAAMIVFCGSAIFGIASQSFTFVNEFVRELIGYV